jgi:hypothetical protein
VTQCIDFLSRVMLRDLAAVQKEIVAYPKDADIWACPPGIDNSAGTLVLHLAGNLQQFIGAPLGGTGYVRDREAEFGERDVPRTDLTAAVERTIAVVREVLGNLDDHALEGEFPLGLRGVRLPTGLFLAHLAAHLGYHLGQIDYHRRVVTGAPGGVGAQAIADLA